jgi:tripartite-type tricarboxylate transporter receptor subunit TctC
LLAPARTPTEVIATLNGAMKTALAPLPVGRASDNLGFTVACGTPEQMKARIVQGKTVYQRVVSGRKIKVGWAPASAVSPRCAM